jgi:hypothetical protein
LVVACRGTDVVRCGVVVAGVVVVGVVVVGVVVVVDGRSKTSMIVTVGGSG